MTKEYCLLRITSTDKEGGYFIANTITYILLSPPTRTIIIATTTDAAVTIATVVVVFASQEGRVQTSKISIMITNRATHITHGSTSCSSSSCLVNNAWYR